MTHWHIKSHACSKVPATVISQIPKHRENSFQITGSTRSLGGLLAALTLLSSINGPQHTHDFKTYPSPAPQKCNPKITNGVTNYGS